MSKRASVGYALIAAFLCMTTAVWADTLTTVINEGSQGANDFADWSQLGPDETSVKSVFDATSGGGLGITGFLGGNGSLVSVACNATPCSWTGSGFPSGDSLIWTSAPNNSGNGPLTLTFGKKVAGAGAVIQADGPGQFGVQIQVFNGATLLGTVSTTSDSSGTATYLGVVDQSGANIDQIVVSLTSPTQGLASDFAIDTLLLNAAAATPTPTPTSPTPTPTTTPIPTPTPTPPPPPIGALTILPKNVGFGPHKVGATSGAKIVTVTNPRKNTGAAVISAVASTDNSDFAIDTAATTCIGATLPKGGKCKIGVRFGPNGKGQRAAKIIINDNASNSPQAVNVQGSGR